MARFRLTRLCLLLWLSVIATDILRAADDVFEDATTRGLPASLAAAALAATICAMIHAATAQTAMRQARRDLRVIAAALWVLTLVTLVMRNTGGHHPVGYLLGFIYVEGLAAAVSTISLVIRAAGGHDKARLIRTLAEVSERSDADLQRHLRQAK